MTTTISELFCNIDPICLEPLALGEVDFALLAQSEKSDPLSESNMTTSDLRMDNDMDDADDAIVRMDRAMFKIPSTAVPNSHHMYCPGQYHFDRAFPTHHDGVRVPIGFRSMIIRQGVMMDFSTHYDAQCGEIMYHLIIREADWPNRPEVFNGQSIGVTSLDSLSILACNAVINTFPGLTRVASRPWSRDGFEDPLVTFGLMSARINRVRREQRNVHRQTFANRHVAQKRPRDIIAS